MFYNFITKSYEQGNRNLLIITGKGQDGEGKIRKSLHTWINKNEFIKINNFLHTRFTQRWRIWGTLHSFEKKF